MHVIDGLRRLWFVLLCTAIVGVGSERMFWYWSPAPLDHLVVMSVYAPAVAGTLWLIDRYRVSDRWGLLLVAPVVGLLVEGVITPVVYTGGPFVPFFPVWFGAWHGVLSVIVLLIGVRSWLLAGRWRTLLVAMVGLGVFWGTWSTTMWLPENLDDPELIADHGGPLQLLDPSQFALYALWVSAVLAGAHLLLGRGGWMSAFEPARVVRAIWLLATAAIVVAWTVAIPWAAPMFVAYFALQRWGLRRSVATGFRPSVLQRLDGRVALRSLWPMAALPLSATSTYAAWWAIDVPHTVVRGAFMYGVIAVQTAVGGVLFVMALHRARGAQRSGAAERPVPPAVVGVGDGVAIEAVATGEGVREHAGELLERGEVT